MKQIFIVVLLSFIVQAKCHAYDLGDFEKTRSTFMSIYTPIVKAQSNLDLEIRLDEDVKNYFGGMNTEGNSMIILMGSELDREKGMTPDLYAFILCHEVGHLLGGAPKKITRGKGALFSSEGQSDYYAASVCLKRIFMESDRSQVSPVSERVAQLCAQAGGSSKEENICRRIVNAGTELFQYIGLIYSDYGIVLPAPNMDAPEADGASIGPEYPSFQCRLDTIVAGATGQGRPGCWFSAGID